jgi:MFS family permease
LDHGDLQLPNSRRLHFRVEVSVAVAPPYYVPKHLPVSCGRDDHDGVPVPINLGTRQGAIGFGWLRASVGLGAGAMTIVISLRPIQRHVGRVLLVAVAVFGGWTIVLGITHSYVLAFVALFALSAADAISVFIRSTLVPLAAPPHMRGRVLAVENVFIGASNELGGFECLGPWHFRKNLRSG